MSAHANNNFAWLQSCEALPLYKSDSLSAQQRLCPVLSAGAGSFAAVTLRLQALKPAVKKGAAAAAAAAVGREVPGYAHGGGGYSFRQRKAAGALAEPSAGWP